MSSPARKVHAQLSPLPHLHSLPHPNAELANSPRESLSQKDPILNADLTSSKRQPHVASELPSPELPSPEKLVGCMKIDRVMRTKGLKIV